ncbi:MAG: 5'-3' exonuclease H3TH domain-containing protein, partial [Bacillaceae bacterium]
HPSQWIDVKALLGDNSDNIPGCPGVGEKSALPLIQQYQCVENLYENIENLDAKFNRYKKKLIAGKESTFISKELATITTSIPQLETIEFDHLQLNINHSVFDEKLNELELRIKK